MSFPQAPCSHHWRGAPLVCTSCAMIRNMGGNDPLSGAGQVDAVTQQYRQSPNTVRQVRQDVNRLYQQRPTPENIYGIDRTIADNIIGSEARPQLQDYPYPTQIDDSDLLAARPAVYQPIHPQRQPQGQAYRSPSNNQPSPYQPNGVSTNGLSMPNGTYYPPQSSRRQQPSAEYYQPSTPPRQDGPARSYRDRGSSTIQNSAVNGYVDDYYEDSSDEERERQRRRRRGRR